MTETLHTPRPSELVEHFLAEAISNSPQPLKDLAEFLSNALGEDDWKIADRLLLALSLRNRTSEPEEGAVAWRIKNKNTGLLQLQAQPLADLPFNRERFDCEPLYTHPAPATADKLRETSAKIGSELEFIKLIAANLKGDIDRMEEGFTKSQRSRGTERVMLEVRQRSDTLIQCAADALAALNEQPQ